MTRFCPDAVGVRSGKSKGLTTRDLRRNIEKFQETGVHPEVQRAREKNQAASVQSLPQHDANRDHVFLDLRIGGAPAGRLVIELFTDLIPAGANHLRNRCLPGSGIGLTGTAVTKLQPGFAAWLGKNPSAGDSMRLSSNPALRHVDAGAVSVSRDGDEVVIALGRALVLDATHQVVGCVRKGEDVLDKLGAVRVNKSTDVPGVPITVARCGVTNAAGTYEEELDAGGRQSKPPVDPAARLAAQSQGARQSVMKALAVALSSQKRKAGDAGEGGTGGADAGVSRNVKSKFMDNVLGDLSGSDDDDTEGSSEGGRSGGSGDEGEVGKD